MHDGQLEDRLRAVLRSEGDGLPLTITPEELDRRLAQRRRDRRSRNVRLMGAGIAAVLVVSFAALTIRWFGATNPGTSPRPSDLIGVAASDTPTSPAPVEPELACTTIDPSSLEQPPHLAIGTWPGDAMAFGGVGSSFRLGDRQSGDEFTWDHDTIAYEPVVAGPTIERIQVLAGDPDACLTGLRVDVMPYTDNAGDPHVRIADVASDRTRLIEFDKPRPGDWFVRIHADLATTSGAPAWRESFFRILVPDCQPLDPATTAELPAIEAGVAPDDVGHEGVAIAAFWNGRTVGTPGSWDGLPIEPDQVVVTPEFERIEFTSDGCMLDVQAEALLTVYGEGPDPLPSPVALNVLTGKGSKLVAVEPPPTGGWTLRVRATFPTTDGSEAWSETLFQVASRFNAPSLTLGPEFFEIFAEAGCPSYQLASGASAADQCGSPYAPMESRDPIPVGRGGAVAFRLTDEWLIDQARVVAVDAELVAAGEFAPEYSVHFDESVGPTLTVPIELDPGQWILRISLNGHRQGDSFGAYYDVAVTVE